MPSAVKCSGRIDSTVGQTTFYALAAGALVMGIALPLIFVALKRQATYTALTIDDLIDYFQEVNQQKVLEIADRAKESQTLAKETLTIPLPYRTRSLQLQKILERLSRRSYVHRRHLRLDLDLLRDYTQRMLHNAIRVGLVAKSDIAQMTEHKLIYSAEQLSGIQEAISAANAFRQIAEPVLHKSWWWSLTRFQERTWGPTPDFARFQIREMLEAYGRVKRAAEAYALFFGDVGKLIAEEIRLKM